MINEIAFDKFEKMWGCGKKSKCCVLSFLDLQTLPDERKRSVPQTLT
jgi:hypothetical protein